MGLFPSAAHALYTRWFHIWGLIAGWAVGLAWGLSMLYGIPDPTTGTGHVGSTALELGMLSTLGRHPFTGSQTQIYVGFVALIGNLVTAAVVTIVLHQVRVPNGLLP